MLGESDSDFEDDEREELPGAIVGDADECLFAMVAVNDSV